MIFITYTHIIRTLSVFQEEIQETILITTLLMYNQTGVTIQKKVCVKSCGCNRNEIQSNLPTWQMYSFMFSYLDMLVIY